MNYASVCSGAEAFGPAWHELGFKPVFHAEIEPHASAVLRYHYPTIPNYGDFTKIATAGGPCPDEPVRLLCGGTPCQPFSIAGLREGIDSYKGNLTLEFIKLAKRLGAKWILWENVPGVLSANNGAAFGSFLGALAECGYGFAYRVLDLQNWGVPQRRKRVFVVAHLGDWAGPAAVLFESESLRRNPAARREAGQDIAGNFGSRPDASGSLGANFDCAGRLVAEHKVWNVAFNDINGSRPDRPLGGLYVNEVDTHKTLHAGAPGETIVQSFTEYAGNAEGALGLPFLTVSNIGKMVNNQTPLCIEHFVKAPSVVRRLIPTETEALMGWERDWTRYGINAKGKQYELADGPRYRICGNGWGQPVVSWIAKRILLVDALLHEAT